MFKKFITDDGMITTVEIKDKGEVTYSVGKKKTTYHLNDCDSIVYELDGEKAIITGDMLEESDALFWFVVNEGENRLEYNNNQCETRRHFSYGDMNDKDNLLRSNEDILENLLKTYELQTIRQAILKLDKRQQKLLKDLFYNDMTITDIAKSEGVNKSSVSKRLHRIKKKLKKLLD